MSSSDMREYAKDLLDGNALRADNGKALLRLRDEMDRLPDEAFAELDEAFAIDDDYHGAQLLRLHQAIDESTLASDYVVALAVIHGAIPVIDRYPAATLH